MFIFFSHWLIKASWRFVVPDLKKSSDEWPVSCSSAHVKLQFKAHKSCVSFGLFNFVSIHTLNKYWFQKFPRSFFYRNRHFTCLGYSFKHHLKPRKVNWRSLFTCKMSTLDPHVNLKHILYFIWSLQEYLRQVNWRYQ